VSHPTPTVYVDELASEPTGLARQFGDAAKAIGMMQDAHEARVVFIKPNLTFPSYKKGVTTRVEFVEELVRLLLRINPRLKILIGEGEGGYNSFSMSEAMAVMGFDQLPQRYTNVQIINLSKMPTKSVVIDTLRGRYEIQLPEIFFSDVDFSISVPLPKVHCMTKVTLSLKNLWGCLPDAMRLKNHYMFSHIISHIGSLLKFRYAFLDGKFGLDHNGPMEGDEVEVNWFVASNHLGAFDVIVSEIMGLDCGKVSYLNVAERYGHIPHRKQIEVIGNMDALKRKFVLKRDFWNYPALAAFHSKNLTYLFYFSKLAKPLHDIMYTFRNRAIQ
jgi:uncharacterized protein (DUF362 family)